MSRARIALFVLEALPNARVVRRFVADHSADIAFVGLSNAERPSSGGLTGQVPTIHALADGPGAFGMTLHRLAATIDTGAILAQEAVPLPADTTATRAAVALHAHGRGLLDRLLDEIARTGRMPEGRSTAVL